jgi:hypothetical protein
VQLTEEQKRKVLRETAIRQDLRIFVETGTYKGDTVEEMSESGLFDDVYSVELSADLFRETARRFLGDEYFEECFDPLKRVQSILRLQTVVSLYPGDSAQRLAELVPRLQGPALFWLDAHPGEPGTAGTYGVTPLRGELRAILDAPRFPHVVLIDDARLFVEDGWPSLDEIQEIASKSGRTVDVVDDIARITSS